MKENACFSAEMDVGAPWDNRKVIPEKILALPIIWRSKPSSCLGVGYTDHTYIKERLHLKLKLKVKIDAHGKKKLEPNQDDAPDHFSQPSVFIRGHLHAQLEARLVTVQLQFHLI